jgi:hypothetical protein
MLKSRNWPQSMMLKVRKTFEGGLGEWNFVKKKKEKKRIVT